MKFLTVPLSSDHKRPQFDCGNQVLNGYLQFYALQDMKRRVSRAYVSVSSENFIKGFYTLSASSFCFESIPESLRKKLPRYPLPAVLIGRLAVNKNFQKQGIGKHLLMDALYRIVLAEAEIGIYAAVVEAKDEQAQAFYERFGFIAFKEHPLKLFLPLSTIKQALLGD